MRIILVLCFSLSLPAVAAAQKHPLDVLSGLYGHIVAKAVQPDLKAAHVKSITKIVGDRQHIKTALFDTGGRYTYFQQDKNIVADSVVYNREGKPVKQYWVLTGHRFGYCEFEYDKDGKKTTFSIDTNGVRTRSSGTTEVTKVKDTTINITREAQHGSNTRKTYQKGNVSYEHMWYTDEKGKVIENRTFYTVIDSAYLRKYQKGRVLENGDLEYMKGVEDTLMKMVEAHIIGQSMFTHVMEFGYAKTDEEKMKIIDRYFPQVKNIEGKRSLSFRYTYDDDHNGRISSYSNGIGMSSYFDVKYDEKGRVIEETDMVNGRESKLYEYDTNGLLHSITIKGETKPEAVFEYTFFNKR